MLRRRIGIEREAEREGKREENERSRKKKGQTRRGGAASERKQMAGERLGSAAKGKRAKREGRARERARGLRGELLFDSGRTVAENTNGRIMKMVLCDAATTLARRDSFQQ